MTTPIDVFFSYAHKDEGFRDELATHLALLQRQRVIQSWHDRSIMAGQAWKAEIDEHLESARIILLLVSADFLASNYCYDIEMKRALERHNAKEATVIPIIVRDCDWKSAPFAELQALPKDAKPVKLWEDRDSAWTSVVLGLRAAISKLAGP